MLLRARMTVPLLHRRLARGRGLRQRLRQRNRRRWGEIGAPTIAATARIVVVAGGCSRHRPAGDGYSKSVGGGALLNSSWPGAGDGRAVAPTATAALRMMLAGKVECVAMGRQGAAEKVGRHRPEGGRRFWRLPTIVGALLLLPISVAAIVFKLPRVNDEVNPSAATARPQINVRVAPFGVLLPQRLEERPRIEQR